MNGLELKYKKEKEKEKEESKISPRNRAKSLAFILSLSPSLSILSRSATWLYHTVLLVAEVLLHLLQCCLIFDFLWSTMNLTLECAESGGAPSVPKLQNHWVTESNRKQQLHQFHQNIHIHTVTNKQMTLFSSTENHFSFPTVTC